MEGFIAILICVIAASGLLLAAKSFNRARKRVASKDAWVILLGVIAFAILGGFAAAVALVLACAWVVTWW